MTDDRTEQALRRALDDAARQVDVPMAQLPEPSIRPHGIVGPNRPRALAAGIAAVAVLVAGSVVVLTARGGDDDVRSIASGGLTAAPIMADDADLDVVMELDVSDQQLAAVRSFAEESSDIAAYTVVSGDHGLEALRATGTCEPMRSYVATLTPDEINVHVRIRLASFEEFATLARDLAALPGVEMVTNRGVRVDLPTSDAPGTTVERIAPTTTAPTSVPEVPSTTSEEPAPTSEPEAPAAPASKEVPFVAPPPAECTEQAVGRTVPAFPVVPPTPTLPPAGEPPADAATAEEEVRAMWTRAFTATTPEAERWALHDVYRTHPERMDDGLPQNRQYKDNLTVKVLDVVFVDPTRAAVRYRLEFPALGGQAFTPSVGFAALTDDGWKVAMETTCALMKQGGRPCPEYP